MEKLVSVIIPVLNAAKHIEQCLKSLVNLEYPKEKVEIIVVDNGSTDDTVEILKKFKVQVLSKENCTIAALRNFGVKQALKQRDCFGASRLAMTLLDNPKVEYLAFVDADCIVPPDWLREAIELLRQDGVSATGCWYALPDEPSFVAKAWDAHMENRRAKVGEIDWVPSGNLIMRRQVFEKIGGFNEFLFTSEDVDICERIRKAGYKIFAHPKLAIVHLGNPKSISDFFKKEVWRGKGVLQNLRFNKSISFALVSLFFFITTAIGLFRANKIIFLGSLVGILAAPVMLSMKAIISSKRWLYFFPLTFLFLIFGLSRAFSLFSPGAWKNILRANRC